MKKDLEPSKANSVMKQVSADEELHRNFKWLDPPSFEKTLNVTDVLQAKNIESHKKVVKEWGLSVWSVWKEKHGRFIQSLSNASMYNY